jgi:hypothetical protein
MKKITLSLVICMLGYVAFGQAGYAFKVIANKGTNQVKSGDGWAPLKPGASLKDSDELQVGENSYLGLVSSNGKPIELKQAGPYKVADLTNKTKGGSSVLNKYTDFILSSNAEGKKNRLSATGAVHRATENNAIRLMLPESQSSVIYNQAAVIKWDAEKTQGPYIVTIKNFFEDELLKLETNEPSVQIDLAPFYAKEDAILIDVKAKNDPKAHSKQYTIRKLSKSEHERVQKLVAEVSDATQEETALNHYLMAGFYEENKLLVDAISAYETAIKLAPEVDMFKEAYQEFLIRNGMKK